VKEEPLYNVDENINWCSYYRKHCENSSKDLTELSFYPEVPLLGIYQNN
jgi:hypothetical protein